MEKKYYIVLGNGFSIDLLQHIQSQLPEKKRYPIDLNNLFSQGDVVRYPVPPKEPGFLSKKYTPNLWNLGARTTLDKDNAMSIIEDLITCANVSLKTRSRNLEPIYKSAYQELTSYLKYLFIHYNSLISDEDLAKLTSNWSWLNFFKRIYQNENIKKVHIITYNYDIWLERIFKLNDVKFSIGGMEETNEKFIIYKPHGSISFAYLTPIPDPSSFEIVNNARDLIVGQTRDYSISYSNLNETIYLQNALIPPAGDSSRLDALSDTWAGTIRNMIDISVRQSQKKDTLIISGLSYWHVDRGEIDSILVQLPEDINVKTINPYPSKTLETVLSGLFKNNVHHSSSEVLNHIEQGEI